MTIGQKLDEMFPAQCVACDTPYRRTEAVWHNLALRCICHACGLDQSSAEAYATTKSRREMQMPNYRVTWEIEITADNHEEAAREALKIQRDPESIATIFDVMNLERWKDRKSVDVAIVP